MNHLIIYAHPNPKSLNASFKTEIFNYLTKKGNKVIIRDLYQNQFNPVLSLEDLNGQRQGEVAGDVRQEQEFITWADIITFIHPIWWTGLPAILKGYIDRVFSYGFAYRYDKGIQKGLLKEKQAVIINTQGKSAEEYWESGMDKALSLTSNEGIYRYCGLEIKHHFFFAEAERADAEKIEHWLKQLKEIYVGARKMKSVNNLLQP